MHEDVAQNLVLLKTTCFYTKRYGPASGPHESHVLFMHKDVAQSLGLVKLKCFYAQARVLELPLSSQICQTAG